MNPELYNEKFTYEITKKYRRMVKKSEVTFIHYQSEFVEWLKNIPQLRHDVLKLYRIQPPP